MGRIGRIIPIKKEYSKASVSLEACLSEKGYTRFPGTSMKIEVAKETNGDYLTGLNPNALYIKRMKSTELKESEQKRVQALYDELVGMTKLDLDPQSPYYKDRYNERLDKNARAQIVNLEDGENIFNLDDPYQAITFAWLRVHPLIASSYQAYERGEYPASTKFYVADDEIEAEITYRKSKAINDAIVILDKMSLEDRRKVARLLGKPVDDNTKEVFVYNMLDKYIKMGETTDGKYKGQNTVRVFTALANLDTKILGARDLIEQAVRLDVYREDRDGTIREGGIEIAKSSEDLAIDLLKTKNQDKLIALDEKVRAKKIAEYA